MKNRVGLALCGVLVLVCFGACDKVNELLDINNSEGTCQGTVGGEEVNIILDREESFFENDLVGDTAVVMVYGDDEVVVGGLLTGKPESEGPHELPFAEDTGEEFILEWSVNGLPVEIESGTVTFKALNSDRLKGDFELTLEGDESLLCSFDLFDNSTSSSDGDSDFD